ncbi:MAG: type II toxin-antitoxin system RelB/DinJ family antitoxin [Clostridia bacterium]|nr:type II toxin-antitoxin system RelB/DinJ family antitoxin [Clostridia bacterium]
MANVAFRMDDKLKTDMQTLVKNLGMDLTTAFNIFAQQAVREQRIPFEIRMDVPNKDTMEAMNNTLEGKNLSKTFDSVAELMEDLSAED